jgi:hypothetical protein
VRAIIGFFFAGGLLIFNSPYLVYQAATKHLPWFIPMIVIPIYAVLSYGAYTLLWPRIIGRSITPTPSRYNAGQ